MQKQINTWIAAALIAIILVVSMLGIGMNAMSASRAAAAGNAVAIQVK